VGNYANFDYNYPHMSDRNHNRVICEYLTTISYKDGLGLQESARKSIQSSHDGLGGYLYVLEHFPVITNGRFGSDDNYVLPVKQIEKLGIEVHRSDRGGELTFHGPGQLVAYPILNLRSLNIGVKKYISLLEQVIINTLSDYGISSDRKEGYPGVWTSGQKIASIGVSVKNGITMHGSALNVSTDLDSFSMIVPCGISDVKVTSMEKTLGRSVNMKDVINSFASKFEKVFEVKIDIKNGPDNMQMPEPS